MDQKAMKNMCAALILLTLFSAVFVLLPTQIAIATTISSISPSSGFVGDAITVNGTIDTPNGFFTIKWNQTLNITQGQATDINVFVSFSVPQTVGTPSGRSVTVELIDDAAATVAPAYFTLYTKLIMNIETPAVPLQLQEGSTIPIAVNVTGGEGNTVYAANITVKDPTNQTYLTVISLSNTTTTGYGEADRTYPTDFGIKAHTNITGRYVVAFNKTVSKEFSVWLTDKSDYRRNETVQIRASGYKFSEAVMVRITFDGNPVADFPKNLTATTGGVVSLSWKVPLNATPGTYNLSIANATSGGSVKTLADSQDFDVLGIICKIQARNLESESVANTLVEVNNVASPNALVLAGRTNLTGWVRFNLDTGNYTFKAFVQNVEVGSRSENLSTDTELILPLRLVNVVATVETEAGEGVPFADITMKYNYTMRNNNVTSGVVSAQTNLTGKAVINNLFTNTTYKVEATRYGMLFNRTTLKVEFSPSSPLNLSLTLPSYTLNVHAIDSQNKSASGLQVRVYEWASGVTTPLLTDETGSSGDASFSLPFGRYPLRVFKGDALLNESVVNLFENPLNLTFYLITANVEVTVSAIDYFGQPIANVEVKIERKVDQEYKLVDGKFTGVGGSTVFVLPVGGDSRISVYMAGKLVGVKTQFLGADSGQVTFSMGEYVSIFGYPIETGLFALFSFLLLLVVVFLFLVRRRVMKAFGKTLKR